MTETLAETRAPEPVLSALAAGTKIAKYTLVRVLGSGGMGVVWAAHDPDLDREVALKLLRGSPGSASEERRRFLREARAMAKLKHPNVLTVYDAGSHDGRDYIAMDLVDGSNLASWLETKPAPDAIWTALLDAGRGLAAAHEAGLVHRDFKPHNVLIRRDGRVLVTDFGLVRSAGEDALEPRSIPAPSGDPVGGDDVTLEVPASGGEKLTHTGTLMGTPAYMAPEQFAGERSDPRTDQFAFSITVCQALTGKRPFQGDSIEALQRAVSRPPDFCSEIGKEVRAVLLRGLAPTAEQRFPTMAALLEKLDHARHAPRRRRIAFAIAGTVFAAIAITLVVWKVMPPDPWFPDIRTLEPTYEENSDAPAISPDGKWVVFGAGRGTNPAWQVYVMPIDRKEEPHAVSVPDCGWSTRWYPNGDLLIVCGRSPESTLRAVRQPMAGGLTAGPPIDLGLAAQAEPCGDRLLVIVQTATTRFLAERSPDGHDRPLVDGAVQRVRCDRTGERYLYMLTTRASKDAELWIDDRGERRKLLSQGIVDFAFTPGSKSVVIARTENQSYDLFELTLADSELHPLTSSADARALDVSPDGSVLVFDKDITSIALFEHSRTKPEGDQRSFYLELLVRPAVTPDGKRVVVERIDDSAIIVIDLATRRERKLVDGRSPFPSHDGKRIYYTAAADPKRLDAISIDGGTPTVVARLPNKIVDGVDTTDGIHVEIGDHLRAFRQGRPERTRGYKLAADGTAIDEQVDGLVFPSASGWRAIRIHRDGRDILQVVRPGKLLDDISFERPINGRPTWIGDHELVLCDVAHCMTVDAETGKDITATSIETDIRSPYAVSPDGAHWYSTRAVGHVTRQKIINFGDRPWKP